MLAGWLGRLGVLSWGEACAEGSPSALLGGERGSCPALLSSSPLLVFSFVACSAFVDVSIPVSRLYRVFTLSLSRSLSFVLTLFLSPSLSLSLSGKGGGSPGGEGDIFSMKKQ